jgi:F0F1-type ATP synthase assembly protein I
MSEEKEEIESENSKTSVKKDETSDLFKFAGIGFEFAGAVLFFLLVGYFVDRHWKCSPAGIVTGSILGIVVGFYHFIKQTLLAKKIDDKRNNRK